MGTVGCLIHRQSSFFILDATHSETPNILASNNILSVGWAMYIFESIQLVTLIVIMSIAFILIDQLLIVIEQHADIVSRQQD